MSGRAPVLILAGTPRVVQAIAQCLNSHGLAVDVGHPNTIMPGGLRSRAVRNVYSLPGTADQGQFCQALRELVDRNGYDMLIPTMDEVLVAILPVYDDLRQRLYPGCPAPEILETVLDKRITLQVAQECGIDVPREYRFSSLEDLAHYHQRQPLPFPLLAKPASKVEEVNFALKYFWEFTQLRDAFNANPLFGQRYLLQEYCPGYGVGVEALIWGAKVHALFQHRRLKEFPATGGVSILAEAQDVDKDLANAAVKLLRKLRWQGIAMVEFRYDPEHGRAVLMEVNGRYWGALPLSVNAGVEFPYYEWQLAHGQEPIPSPYKPGFRTLWRTGDMMRLISVIRGWQSGKQTFRSMLVECWQWAREFFSTTSDALWRWSDPLPAIQEFRQRLLSPLASPRSYRRLLPAGLMRQLLTYRYYGWKDGLRHTYLVLRDSLLPMQRVLPRNSTSILFVCSGNIMRSPLAGALLNNQLKNSGLNIGSAGLFAQPGRPADPTAVVAAQEMGISLDGHRSSRLTAEMVDRYDVIFVMDHLNEAVLLNRFPRAAGKTFLLAASVANKKTMGSVEIQDPFGCNPSEVRKCYAKVRNCIELLSEFLQQQTFHIVRSESDSASTLL